jgi:hypothetical protein
MTQVTKYGRVETEVWDKSKLKYREYALVPPTEAAPVTPTLATRETLFFHCPCCFIPIIPNETVLSRGQ